MQRVLMLTHQHSKPKQRKGKFSKTFFARSAGRPDTVRAPFESEWRAGERPSHVTIGHGWELGWLLALDLGFTRNLPKTSAAS
eukprot:6482884-Amphidinium_carterae.1